MNESSRLLDDQENRRCSYGSNNPQTFISSQTESNDVVYQQVQNKLKNKLKYFLMNPIEKWRTKGKIPWKLGLQVVKIIIITVQLGLFGSDNYKYELQKYNTEVSFRHIFLKDWKAGRDNVVYPPSFGAYAVYTKSEFFDSINFVIDKHSSINLSSVGSFRYDTDHGEISSITLCKIQYRSSEIWSFNSTVVFDTSTERLCLEILPIYPAGDPRWHTFSIEKYIKEKNFSINFDSLLNVKLNFSLNAIYLKPASISDVPDCYKLHIFVNYDNSKHDGQMVVSLDMSAVKGDCRLNVKNDYKYIYAFRQLLNAIVIIVCVLSLILCVRSLYRAQILRRKIVQCFNRCYGKILPFEEQVQFIDLWYVMIIINDILIIIGSAIKIELEHKTIEGDQYDNCSIFLGTGNLLVWAGVLRYLGFFKKYNILILTIKRALPNVMRFMLCAILLYSGFCFCGWLVLGPYHIKFQSLSSTSECLFSMMNGDDLFATFAIINTQNSLIWWFSRFYLYLFISLFIYVVISLFISVIMDSYETIKEVYTGEIPKSELQLL
ncbi:mucolipin-3-like [Centruroides vittatus]|uniref:mucolipin-3-like n=1 Tax=Centruroides vittatus TaxID=120091 RepID=UPI00350FAC52